MADSNITLPGSGQVVDTRTITGGDHRQVLVIGDPTTPAGVAPVDAVLGLTVNMAATSPGIVPTATLTAGTAPAAGIATLGQYNATNPAPTDTQSVGLQLGPNGQLLVQPYGNPANYVSGVTAAITTTTQTALLAAAGAGLRYYITQITVSNKHATIGTDVEIRDGSTAMYVIPAAAAYGGAVLTFPTPLRATTANAINCAASPAADVRVSISGYKGI